MNNTIKIMILDYVDILGKRISLSLMEKNELKGVFVGALLEFNFYKASYAGMDFCVLQQKKSYHLTPLKMKRYADLLKPILNKDVVFLFEETDFNVRSRMIDCGVYFIVPQKYVFLPTLVSNRLLTKEKQKISSMLSPVSQSVILLYLQDKSFSDHFTINVITNRSHYSYVSIAKAVRELEKLGLCTTTVNENKEKVITMPDRKILWSNALPYLSSPVKKVVYADSDVAASKPICGINALAHFTMLAPETYSSRALTEKEFKSADWSDETNEVDGLFRIEIWKYPPIIVEGNKYIDKLSLYLSLMDDPDARVEGELERLIDEFVW